MTVRLAQTYILGGLRHQTFFSLADCNAAILTVLEDLNGRPMRLGLNVSRKELSEAIERPALQSLPACKRWLASPKSCSLVKTTISMIGAIISEFAPHVSLLGSEHIILTGEYTQARSVKKKIILK